MNDRRTRLGCSRPLRAFTVSAVLVLGALGPAITGRGVAPPSAPDHDASPPPANGTSPRIDAVPDAARNLIADHCTRCHNDDRRKGNLDLTSLAYDPADAGNFALWVKIHDRVAAGEMPPEDAKQPERPKREAFVASLAGTFVAS